MAVRNIALTDTLETFRQEFNALAANDFGDLANLSGAIAATNLVDAMNETISIATSTAGWTMEDSSSSQQIVGGGQIARFLGSSNQITAVVSAPDTLTVGLTDNVTINTSLTAPTLTGGSIQISGNEIQATDSSTINVPDTLTATSLVGGDVQLIDVGGRGTIKSASGSNQVINMDLWPIFNSYISFEGATDNNFETDIFCTDPTADRTITIPDATGTIALTNTTGYASSTIFTSSVSLIIYNSSGVAQKTIHGSAS